MGSERETTPASLVQSLFNFKVYPHSPPHPPQTKASIPHQLSTALYTPQRSAPRRFLLSLALLRPPTHPSGVPGGAGSAKSYAPKTTSILVLRHEPRAHPVPGCPDRGLFGFPICFQAGSLKLGKFSASHNDKRRRNKSYINPRELYAAANLLKQAHGGLESPHRDRRSRSNIDARDVHAVSPPSPFPFRRPSPRPTSRRHDASEPSRTRT